VTDEERIVETAVTTDLELLTEAPPVVGTRARRVDALAKVTGAAPYVDDLPFGGNLLIARLKRSTRPHARIVSIDTSRAEALPGVKAVVTGRDFPQTIGLYLEDRTLYAVDKVRFVGEPVAGVAAVSEEVANEAVALIEVVYEDLPVVSDPLKAIEPGAPILHPNLGQYACASFIWPVPGTNIANRFRVRKGDADAAFASCDVVCEGTYRVPHIQHVPLETHIAVAQQTPDGHITLWTSSQSPFAQRALLAKALGLPHDQIRVITRTIGGGFGSKAGVSIEACVVPLAMRARGRPVKLRLSREEEFHTTFVRQALVATVKIGAKRDGRILAMQNRFVWSAGAYAEYGVNITRAAGYSSTGPYEVPNVWTDSLCAYTNAPVGGPMRGFGMPEIHWAIEQQMDELARALNMDPVDLRRLNAVREGSILATGGRMHATGLDDCIRLAAEGVEWGQPSETPGPGRCRGKGIAAMWKAPAMPPDASSSAIVKFNENGSVFVMIGGTEIGQGTATVMAQMAAETLGVPFESVSVSFADTESSPYEWQTVASRLTWSMGNAVVAASQDARRQIQELVAPALGVDPDDVAVAGGQVYCPAANCAPWSLREVVTNGVRWPDGRLHGGPIIGRGHFVPPDVSALDPETGQGEKAVVHWTTGAQAVEVEVDEGTGEVTVLRVAAAYDVGRAINPGLVENQVEGGVVQGLSSALFEELKFVDGQPVNAGFTDYKIATALDAPGEIVPIIVEEPQEDGPFGARGVGEHTMIPTAPAIANAIAQATGVRIRDLPLSRERVFMALHPNLQT
jgi:carbon-monoxide dehydrogenase large subunit